MLDSSLAVGDHSGAGRRGLPPLGWRTGVLLSVLQHTETGTTTKSCWTLKVNNPKTKTTRLRWKQVLEETVCWCSGSEISGCL